MHHPRTKLATTLDRVLTGARRAYAERVRRQLTASRFGLLAVAAAIALIPIDLLRVGGVTDNHVASADALRRVAFIPRQEPTADAWEHAVEGRGEFGSRVMHGSPCRRHEYPRRRLP
jgi:hypothetical protein